MFDLSMQSALDIFCYVLVLIYGLALSADISTGGHVSRQQKYLLTLCACCSCWYRDWGWCFWANER